MSVALKKMYWWVRTHVSAIAFASGFIWDTLTLKRIDLLYENIVFISYLIVAFIGIVLLHGVETRRFTSRVLLNTRAWLPILVQFPMGGLMSGFMIFYSKSASILTSWPFLAILLTLLVGNEFFRKRYEKLVFQVGMFYFALISYITLTMPILHGAMGASIFLFGGILSLLVMAGLLARLYALLPKLFQRGGKKAWGMVAFVYVVFNTLYFSNIIPPVPLVLTEIGIYHSVVRSGLGEYVVTYEEPKWYEVWRSTHATYHKTSGEAGYCFSSVFAPTSLRVPIYHSWQRKSEQGRWTRDTRVRFTIEGGRLGGYRGYTIKQNLQEGEWRCVVETETRQVIGEVRFKVVVSDTPTLLKEGVR